MISFRYTSGVRKHKKTILSYMMGQKLSSKLSGSWILQVYISHGSGASQLKCGGIFINHFVTNFSQIVPVKQFEICSLFCEDMHKSLRLTFLGPPVYMIEIQTISVCLSITFQCCIKRLNVSW